MALAVLLIFNAATVAANADAWRSIGPDGGSVRAVSIDPQDSATVYVVMASGRIFKSSDHAQHWSAIGSKVSPYVLALSLDPNAPDTLHTFGGENLISRNAGLTWENDTTLPSENVYALVFDKLTPTIAYVTTERGILRSLDAGRTWELRSHGLPGGFAEALISVGESSSILYALYFNRVFRSDDRAETWNDITSNLPTDCGSSYYCSAGGACIPRCLAGVVADHHHPEIALMMTDGEGIFRTTDAGQSWGALPKQAPRAGKTISIDPIDSATIFVGGGFGVSKSTDRGQSWSSTDLYGMPPDRVQALAIDPLDTSRVYVGTELSGVFASTDAAQSWKQASLGLRASAVCAIAAAPTDPVVLYAAMCDDETSLYKSILGSDSWQPIGAGLGYGGFLAPTALAVDPLNPKTVYAGTPNGVYRSDDAGESFSRTNSGETVANGFVLLRTSPPTLCVSGRESGVLCSTNGGASWRPQRSGLPSTRESYISKLAADPETPATAFAVSTEGMVYRSANAGMDWEQVNESRVGQPYQLAAAPGALYLRSPFGVHRSLDGGRTWTLIHTYLSQLAVIASRPREIYALDGASLLWSVDRGDSWRRLDGSLGTPYGLEQLFVSSSIPDSLFVATQTLGVRVFEHHPADGHNCSGDCGGDGSATIDELIVLISIALESVDASACVAGDYNADGRISIDEVVGAVADALGGCGN